MNPITLTSFGHSTIRLEQEGRSLVVDPGTFAPEAAFANVAAFLVTHDHPDHADVARIATALAANRSTRAWVSREVASRLVEAGAEHEQVSPVLGDDSFDAAGFAVRAFVGEHAEIHHSLPASPNIAFLIDNRVLHPGDAFPDLGEDVTVDVLLLPVSGPWMRFGDAVDYVEGVRPQVVVPIHDGDLVDLGRELTDQMSGLFAGRPTYRRLDVGESLKLDG